MLLAERRSKHLEGINSLSARSSRLIDRMTKIMSESVVRFGVKIDAEALIRLCRYGTVLRDAVHSASTSERLEELIVNAGSELQRGFAEIIVDTIA